MEKLMTGAAVFFATVCGQPDLLATLCIYLFVAILLASMAVMAMAPAFRRSPVRVRRQPTRERPRR